MKAIDWSKIYQKYKGKWVAVKTDHKTVIASGDSAKEVWEKAQEKGYKNPILSHLPKKLISLIGFRI